MNGVVPAGYAVLVWWFTTGLILFLDGLRPASFRWSMAAATALLVPVAFLVHSSADDVTAAGAYAAFTCAILVWGWLEMSFLMGFITGPRKHACAGRCMGWPHFLHAVQAILYNELATCAGAIALGAATWQHPNRVALWTYSILWGMRLSAKLNLFLGVRNLGEKFLPAHLQYLRGFFRRRAANVLFPFSVAVSTLATVFLLRRCLAATDGFHVTAYAMLTSLLGLGVVEHWFMVLPLPSERLWSWAMKRAEQP